MLSRDGFSGSTEDPCRMMNAATTNATKHATAAHQWSSKMLAHTPMKNMSRTESRQHSDHKGSPCGKQATLLLSIGM